MRQSPHYGFYRCEQPAVVNGKPRFVVLRDVVLEPAIMFKLLSVWMVRRKGLHITIDGVDEGIGSEKLKILP